MFYGQFPYRRMRRLRTDSFMRRLVEEHQLSACDLLLPVFIRDQESCVEEIVTMPGTFRLGRTELLRTAETCIELGVGGIALFPVIAPECKSANGDEAYNPDGVVPRLVQELKQRFPELGVITDVALDPYTTHGQDGLINASGYVVNDETVEALARQALCHAEAGVDIVAPSDMMDGRIRGIREALEEKGFVNTKILAYAAKYASSFYAPFRDAVDSAKALGQGDKRTYQMNPANIDEALHEVALDLEEGADLVMVKPGMFYLDVVRAVKEQFKVPTLAYQVSGEYAMFKATAMQGWLDERACVLEALLGFKRAGCNAVLSYYAIEAARWLKEGYR